MSDAQVEAGVIETLNDGPLFEGLFTAPEEVAAIRRLLARRQIERVYLGPAGFLGLAKLKVSA